MSPEQRAAEICEALALAEAEFDQRDWVGMPKHNRERYVARCMLAAPAIATAIREAENAKLEQAILFCDGEAKAKDLPGDDPRFYAGRREAGRRLVRLVRSLKSQEP